MEAAVRSSPANQLITGSIKGLSVVSCIYAPKKRSSTQVLRFLSVFLHVFLNWGVFVMGFGF